MSSISRCNLLQMKSCKFAILLVGLFSMPLSVAGQNPQTPITTGANPQTGVLLNPTDKRTSPEMLAAIDMLRSLSDELRKDFDKPEAITLEARIGDILWNIDEVFARGVFRRAFDAASEPVEDISTMDAKLREHQLLIARRRAAALAEVLRLLGKHDAKTAEDLLAKYEADKLDKGNKKDNSSAKSELLAQIALELAESKPDQAQRLGIMSLAGRDVPEAIERLLFALSKQGKNYSDPLFVTLLENLRRNGYPYDNALNSLCNYVFLHDGRMFSNDYREDAFMLVGFFVDAARFQVSEWRQSKVAGTNSISNSAASFHRFFLARALPIVKINAPDKVLSVQAALEELSSGLSQQQRQEADDLVNLIQQQRRLGESLGSSLEDRLKRVENEKDVVVRDNLRRSIAIAIMRDDAEQALSIAAKIDDPAICKQTEDDIVLVIASGKLKLRNYVEARSVAAKLNDLGLRARTLAAIATANKSAGTPCDIELLSEAYSVATRDEVRPEKVRVILSLARQFSQCSTERGFELLSAAIKIANQLPASDPEKSSLTHKRQWVESYTVVGGQELTTEVPITRESVTFDDAAVFAKRDFIQAQNLGYQIDDRIFRARYFIAIARSVLPPTPVKSARN